MEELERFLQKEKHKKFLELFMIIEEISKTEDIISFTYNKNYLIVQIGVNDYYRIHLKSKEVK